MNRYPSVAPMGTVRASRIALHIGQRCNEWLDARTGQIGIAHGIVLREATQQEFLAEDPTRMIQTAALRFYLISMD